MELTALEKTRHSKDLIFPSAERQDRLYAQLNKKINRQNQWITALKMWGRC